MLKLLFTLMSLALMMMLPGLVLAIDGGVITVPEPTTILLLVSGLLGLWGFSKRFQK